MIHSFFLKKLLVRTGIVRYLPGAKRLLRGGERYLHYLSDRALATPLDELTDSTLFPEVQSPDAIHLAMGAPRCEIPLGSLRGVQDRRSSGWGLAELRKEIAARHETETGQPLAEDEQVLVTPGASGAFAAVIDTFINPGDRAVLFDPTSPIFSIGLTHRRARIHWVPSWLDAGQIRFNTDTFARAMKGAKLLVLADPASPTGGVLAGEDLEQIAFWAKKYDVLIYHDDVFGRYRDEPAVVNLHRLPNAERRLLTAGSISKTFGLPGARVGWLTGHRHLLGPIATQAALNAPFVSTLCQQVALTALANGEVMAASLREEFAGRRRYVYERLQQMGLSPTWPKAGFFFWISVRPWGLTGREFARRLLDSKKVLVQPGDPFGPSGTHHIRISIATEEGRLREGLARLGEFMKVDCGDPPLKADLRPAELDELTLAAKAN